MAVGSVSFALLMCVVGLLHQSNASVALDRDYVEQCRRQANEVDGKTNFNCGYQRNIADYYRDRANLISAEIESAFGSDVKLTEVEQQANKIIVDIKEAEFKAGLLRPDSFNPSRHIFDVLNDIKQSKLFQIIKTMPKGAVLHAHDTALCSADYVVSLTYWSDLWQRTASNSDKILEFRFSRRPPSEDPSWRLVKDVRDEKGAASYDQTVRSMFTLFNKNVNPRIQFRDINDVWDTFMDIFIRITPIVTYKPVWKAYFKQALKEMMEDGVQYLEFRTTLPKLYDLDGNEHEENQTMDTYIEALEEFKREHPSFIGSRMIYAPLKLHVNESANYFNIVRQLHARYPHFLAGFDLVGQEDVAPGLLAYAEHILQLPESIKLFFHAGETNWFGSIDENLIDAVLLGSRRVGHGYALAKHPKVIDIVKRNGIAVEVNPVSNQVLKLVDDYRNHPASVFLAQNVPVVISSDDPSFWEVAPLTHDFYMAFLGIASRHSDLRTLKKFAINSIQHSSLGEREKENAFAKWQRKWDAFIDDLVHPHC